MLVKGFAVMGGTAGCGDGWDSTEDNFEVIRVFTDESKAYKLKHELEESDKKFSTMKMKFCDLVNKFATSQESKTYSAEAKLPEKPRKPIWDYYKDKNLFQQAMKLYELSLGNYKEECKKNGHRQFLQKQEREQIIKNYREEVAKQISDGQYTAGEIGGFATKPYGYEYRIQEVELDIGG